MVVKEKEEEATAVERSEVDDSHVEPEAGLGNSKVITLFGAVTTVLADFELAREVDDDIAKQGSHSGEVAVDRAIYQP